MLKRYELKERVLIIGALLCSMVLVYLLHDDSIFDQWSTGDNQRIGEVLSLENDVRHKAHKGFQWRVLRRPRSLNWGDGIFTGKGSVADVELDDGSRIHLQENSLMIFTPSQKDLLLDLKFGNFKGTIAEDSSIKVNDGGGIVDLTGKNAQIEIGRSADGDLAIKVLNGEMKAKTADGIDRSFTAGTIAKKDKNGSLVAEAPKPKAEVLDRKPAFTKATWRTKEISHETFIPVDENAEPTGPAQMKLKWEAANKKQAYELQIATDAEFKNVIDEEEVTGDTFETDTDAEGSYFVRLKPLDGGDDTWSSTEVITVRKAEAKPLATPQLKQKNFVVDGLETSEVKLDWQKVDKAQEYVVEMSPTENFSQVTKSLKTKEPTTTISEFSEGKNFVRIRALTSKGRVGSTSDVAKINVKSSEIAIEPIPEIRVLGKSPLAPPEPVELKIKWSETKIAKAYELNISKDPEFSAPLKFKTASPSGSLKVKDPGAYHVRVRPLDHLGNPMGTFSPPQKVDYVYRIPLAQPTLAEPAANITMFFQTGDAPFWFVWKKVQQAEWYVLEIATDNEFKNRVAAQKVTENRFLFKPDSRQGQLYWRVKAFNTERESHWSQTRAVKVFSGRKAAE